MHSIIDDLAASNEELQSANEEILSSNEELQSTNEELDTAKEEMQSTNEELSTLNDELHTRNDELSALNSDLVNLLATVQIPIVMVTRDLRIRRFTPAAETAMNIIPSDIGRPIGHLKPNFDCPDLEAMIAEVVETVSIRERQVERTDNGRVFTLQIRPYKSMENRVDGAVVVMFDVSSAQDQAAALEVSRATSDAAMGTAHEPILLLDGTFKVIRANHAFLDQFQAKASAIEGTTVYDLGDGAWNIPALHRLLEKLLPQKRSVDNFEIVHDFGGLGRKRLRVDARRIESGRRKQGAILLVFRQITESPA
jgi:two-component system, chemotaxis family, CheB/CheR fusion protein